MIPRLTAVFHLTCTFPNKICILYAQFERKDVKMREDLIHSKAEKKKLSKITKKSIVVVQACKEQIQALMEDEPSRNEDVGKSKLTKIKRIRS